MPFLLFARNRLQLFTSKMKLTYTLNWHTQNFFRLSLSSIYWECSLVTALSSLFWTAPQKHWETVEMLPLVDTIFFQEQTQSFRRTDLFCILQTLPLLHPVNEMSSVYVLALRKPVEEDDGDIVPTMSIYDVVIENIRLVQLMKHLINYRFIVLQ